MKIRYLLLLVQQKFGISEKECAILEFQKPRIKPRILGVSTYNIPYMVFFRSLLLKLITGCGDVLKIQYTLSSALWSVLRNSVPKLKHKFWLQWLHFHSVSKSFCLQSNKDTACLPFHWKVGNWCKLLFEGAKPQAGVLGQSFPKLAIVLRLHVIMVVLYNADSAQHEIKDCQQIGCKIYQIVYLGI